MKGDQAKIEKYIKKNKAILNKEYNAFPFIFHVVRHCSLDIFKLFIKYGSRTNTVTSYGGTLLHLSVWLTKNEIASFLIQKDLCKINSQNCKGETALHVAIHTNNIGIIEFLISSNANVGLPNKEGNTPLQCAVQLGRIDAARIIISSTMLKSMSLLQNIKINESTENNENQNKVYDIRTKLSHCFDIALKSQSIIQKELKDIKNLSQRLAQANEITCPFPEEVPILGISSECRHNSLNNKLTLEYKITSECPICLQSLKPPVQIYQCIEGHYFCETCKQNPHMKTCPYCRVGLAENCARVRCMEEVMRIVFSR